MTGPSVPLSTGTSAGTSSGPGDHSMAVATLDPSGAPALPDLGADADTVAALALSCPAVAGLSGGPLGSAATYLPGRKVNGIRLRDDAVEIHPVLVYGATVTELAGQLRQALAGHVGDRTVDVVVEDVQLPGAPATDTASRPAAVPGAVPGAAPAGDPSAPAHG